MVQVISHLASTSGSLEVVYFPTEASVYAASMVAHLSGQIRKSNILLVGQHFYNVSDNLFLGTVG